MKVCIKEYSNTVKYFTKEVLFVKEWQETGRIVISYLIRWSDLETACTARFFN